MSLEHEREIVWLIDPRRTDYVRQAVDLVPFRSTAPGWTGRQGRLAGYAVLDEEAQSHNFRFKRRVFWLEEYDRGEPREVYDHGCPAEAVDPLTVEPGVRGERTSRCWGPADQ